MRRPLAILSLSFAWLCANGVVWDVVQVFAWTKMFAGYAQTMTVSVALKETFDPSKPCDLCVTVTQAKNLADQQSPARTEQTGEKLLLACPAAAPIVFVNPLEAWAEAPAQIAPLRVEPVPVRPPRV